VFFSSVSTWIDFLSIVSVSIFSELQKSKFLFASLAGRGSLLFCTVCRIRRGAVGREQAIACPSFGYAGPRSLQVANSKCYVSLAIQTPNYGYSTWCLCILYYPFTHRLFIWYNSPVGFLRGINACLLLRLRGEPTIDQNMNNVLRFYVLRCREYHGLPCASVL